jgi:hypothetical protein
MYDDMRYLDRFLLEFIGVHLIHPYLSAVPDDYFSALNGSSATPKPDWPKPLPL